MGSIYLIKKAISNGCCPLANRKEVILPQCQMTLVTCCSYHMFELVIAGICSGVCCVVVVAAVVLVVSVVVIVPISICCCCCCCCCSYCVLLLHISALFESVVAGICALVVVKPRGSLMVTSCPVTQLADWYTLFQNPSPDYIHTIYCTQEAVYPL